MTKVVMPKDVKWKERRERGRGGHSTPGDRAKNATTIAQLKLVVADLADLVEELQDEIRKLGG